jgi:hypothetical protein
MPCKLTSDGTCIQSEDEIAAGVTGYFSVCFFFFTIATHDLHYLILFVAYLVSHT